MPLCPRCVAIADLAIQQLRIANKGVIDRENNKWAQEYNKLHKAHAAPPKRGRKKAA